MKKNALLMGGCLLAWSVSAAGVSFDAKPTAVREGGNIRIRFTVAAPTDVEVAVLDAGDKIVCHLAAGVLGGTNAPPQPLKLGLAQELAWDGKDDAGKPAAGGPFRVRVRLGMKPEFDSFLLENPVATGRVTALAIGPGGQLYLWHRDCTANENQGANKLKVISREGKYVRTLMPFPANLPPEKANVLGAFTDADGRLVPRIYNLQQLNTYYEAMGQRGRPMSDAISPAVDSRGRAYWLVAGGRLEAVEANGAPPYETFLSEPVFPDVKYLRGQPVLCMGSDSNTLYAAGIGRADDEYGKNAVMLPCVWRIDTATRKAEIFLGDLKETGKAKDRFTAPRGLAAARGLLYVADPDADRVAVFQESDRAFVGEIKVKNPQSIGVDPASGAVYVCAYTGKGLADLIKFSGVQDDREVCRLTLPKTYESGTHRIAVDASAQPPRLWLPTLRWQTGEIYCYEDLGDKFADKGDPRNLQAPWADGPRDLTVDRDRGELYVKHGVQRYYRLDVKTGKVLAEINLRNVAGSDKSAGTQLVPAPDGSLVTLSWNTGLRRMDRDGKPINWPGRDSNAIPYGGIMTFQQRYLAVPSLEELCVILPPNYRHVEKGQEGHGKYSSVNVIGTDGATRRTLVWQCSAGAVLRLDARGNIYLADMLKPLGRSFPEFFDDKFGKTYTHSGSPVGGEKFAANPNEMSRFWESSMYGSIIKFPPTGGIIWYDKDLPSGVEGQPSAELLAKPRATYGRHIGYDFKPVDVQGAEWVRFGFSPWAEPRGAGFCMCEGVGFDVDGFGRVFYPNLGQFRIEVVDTANNWIGSFGQYGNPDDGVRNAERGMRNGEPTPALPSPHSELRTPHSSIPLAWPTYVALGDDCAFVNDTVGGRVVKVKLGAAAEAFCELR
jgi:hypothetical protein